MDYEAEIKALKSRLDLLESKNTTIQPADSRDAIELAAIQNSTYVPVFLNGKRVNLALYGSNGYLIGTGTMVGGILDVTDSRVTSSSKIFPVRTGSADSGSFPQLSANYYSGTTMRIFEGSFAKTWTIDYVIFF